MNNKDHINHYTVTTSGSLINKIMDLIKLANKNSGEVANQAAKQVCQLITDYHLIISEPIKSYSKPGFGINKWGSVCTRCSKLIKAGEYNWFLNKDHFHDACLNNDEKMHSATYLQWLEKNFNNE